jgi:hypothetical protein
MNSSIIGENTKYKNADGSALDAAIQSKTKQLTDAQALYAQAMDAITICGNSSSGCLSKTGRHISTWRDQRDLNAPLIERYKTELSELLDLKVKEAATQIQTAASMQATSAANTAISEANKVSSEASVVAASATASKVGIYLLIAGGLIVLTI